MAAAEVRSQPDCAALQATLAELNEAGTSLEQAQLQLAALQQQHTGLQQAHSKAQKLGAQVRLKGRCTCFLWTNADPAPMAVQPSMSQKSQPVEPCACTFSALRLHMLQCSQHILRVQSHTHC